MTKYPQHQMQKNIGFIFNQIMDCQKQISPTCKSAWYQLRNISNCDNIWIKNKLSNRFIHKFVSSKFDINNALLYDLPDTLLHKLQVIQNAAPV